MGPFASIAGGIAGIGIGSFINNGISALFGNYQQKQNLKMMREQMAFQTAEREASQAYQTSEREAMQGYQTSERNAQNVWQESMYGKYQSPEAMVRQYNEAGINGKLAASGQAGMGSMSVSGGSNGGAPSSGAPSGHSVSAPYQNIDAWSSGFQDIAGALKALADAKRAGVETKQLETMFDEEFKKLKLANEAQELANYIQSTSGVKKASAEAMQAFQDLATGKLNQQEIRQRLKLLKQEFKLKQLDLDHWYDRFFREEVSWAAEVGKAQSVVRLNEAMANNADKIEPQYKRSIIQLNQSEARINGLIADLQETKNAEQINVIIAEAKEELARLEYLENKYGGKSKDYSGPATIGEIKSADDVIPFITRGIVELKDIVSDIIHGNVNVSYGSGDYRSTSNSTVHSSSTSHSSSTNVNYNHSYHHKD